MQTPKECLNKVLFNSIKREQRYHEFKLDVQKETNRQRDRPGPRGGSTRGGPPKNSDRLAQAEPIPARLSLFLGGPPLVEPPLGPGLSVSLSLCLWTSNLNS